MGSWDDLAVLRGKAPPKRRKPAAKQLSPDDPAFAFLDYSQSLSDGLGNFTRKLVQLKPVLEGCEFLRHAVETGGADYTEPLWHMTTLMSVFLEHGDELVHRAGKEHHGYDKEDTEDKYEKAKENVANGVGWPACTTIKDRGSPFCVNCPHFGFGKTPLHLSSPVVIEQEQPADIAVPQEVVQQVTDLMLPTGYVLSGGLICRIEEVETPDGQTVNVARPMFRTVLTNPWISDNPLTLHLTTINGPRTGMVQLLSSDISERKIFSTLLDHKVFYTPEGKKFMEPFLVAWIDKLYRTAELQQPGLLGWQYDNGVVDGFGYGGTVFKRNGQQVQQGMFDSRIAKVYTPVGEIEPWFRAAETLCKRQQYEFEIMLASAFAAPLMPFTGQQAAMMWFWSREGGKGKTSAVQTSMAVWGNPAHAENQHSTVKSIPNKLGVTHSLPIYWDDLQDDALNQAFRLIHIITAGMEGSRLNRAIQQQERGAWHTLLVCCANTSITDLMLSKESAQQATASRVFEIPIPDKVKYDPDMTSTQVDRLTYSLQQNFGQVGLIYAKFLADNYQQLNRWVSDLRERVHAKLEADNSERMWTSLCAALLAGARIAKGFGVNLHYDELEELLFQLYARNRARVKGLAYQVNAESLLTDFLNAHENCALWTDQSQSRGGKVIVRAMPSPGVRFDRLLVQWCQGDNTVRFHKASFIKYIEERRGNVSAALHDLKADYDAITTDHRRVLGSGSPYALAGRVPIIEIPIPETPTTPEQAWLREKLMAFQFSQTGPNVVPFPVPDKIA